MQTNPGNMKSDFTEALCSTHAAHVNLNIFVAGQYEIGESCSNKTPTNSKVVSFMC